MRKPLSLEPRLAALSSSDLHNSERTSWMPRCDVNCVSLDPARWSQRARQKAYWRMVEIWNRARTLH